MKKTLFIALFVFSMHFFVSAQVQWTNYHNFPVLVMDTTYKWEAIGQPTCILMNDTFKMWYASACGSTPSDPIAKGRIFYAWSLNGVNWNRYSIDNPVLDVSGPGHWDGEWLDTPEILWDGTEYKLYYYGDSTYYQGQSHTALGLATSPDGINWTRQGKVLEMGALNEWDGHHIESPAMYHDPSSGVYAMWYTGLDTIGYGRIGLAVSPDGYYWIKDTANPVLDLGIDTAWDNMYVAVPGIIESNGIFEMWYSGVNYPNLTCFVGYATSINGTDWIKYPGNPVLSQLVPDTQAFWALDVAWDYNTNLYKMWYEDIWLHGDSLHDTTNAIYYATAPRTVLYSSNCVTSVTDDTTITQGSSITLSATGGDYFQWTPSYGLNDPSSGTPIATPDTTITYYVMIVGDSCITRDSLTITVTPLSDIKTETKPNSIKIRPNPFHDYTTIEFDNQDKTACSLYVYNSLGKIVRAQTITSSQLKFDRGKLTSGMYFLEIKKYGQIVATEKMVVE